jgi:hypothetical protein
LDSVDPEVVWFCGDALVVVVLLLLLVYPASPLPLLLKERGMEMSFEEFGDFRHIFGVFSGLAIGWNSVYKVVDPD